MGCSRKKVTVKPATNSFLPNSAIAELLALAAETAKMPFQKALRRASRKAFLWPEEAALILQENRSLTELPAEWALGVILLPSLFQKYFHAPN
jgi:hypothetical protein